MQLCALPVCEDGGSSWVNIDSSDPDVVSGMSTVESIEVVSNVSSDGGRSQTRGVSARLQLAVPVALVPVIQWPPKLKLSRPGPRLQAQLSHQGL